jgi:zinc protease
MSRLAFCLIVLLPITALRAESPKVEAKLALRTAAALYDGIESATLDNGLRVYLKPIPSSSSVTTMLVYKVGSCDEDKSFTGLSHYLEHLLFKGTAKLKPGDIDRITFRAGGSNNAYTSTDMTAYHFTLPSAWMNAALEVEADRMRNVRIDKEHEFDKEKGAVISELARNEDGPWDLEYKAILPVLFGKGHPYGHPVIGEVRHVKDANEKVIKAHYDAWYHPNNASLIIVGGFDPKAALATITKLFGPIPRAKLPPRKTIPDDVVKLPARTQFVSKFSQARLMVGFPTVKSGDDDQPALAVLDAVLSRGKRSRLYRSLVEGAAVASDAGSDHSPGRYPGWINATVEVLPGKDRAGVEKLLLSQLSALRDKEVSAEELARAKQLLLAATIYRNEDTYGLANSIGEAVTLNDLDFAKKYLPRMLAVTAEDVQRVAKKYLDPKRSATVWSVPVEENKAGRSVEKYTRKLARHGTSARADKAATGVDLKKTRRVELPNGLVVLLYEDKRLPLFVAGATLRASSIHQDDTKLGVAALTGSLLDEGTAKRTGAEISDAIETVGGSLSLSSSGGTVKSLSPDRKLALSLLLESMVEPNFPADAFRRAHARLLAEITESETQSNPRARRAFTQAAYGAHPLGRPSSGTTKTVFGLTRADCEAFHKRVFVPSNTILVLAGDFDGDEMLADIKRLTADWKDAPLPKPTAVKVARPKEFTTKILTMPKAAQLQIYMGHVGIRRDDPDYYKLLVMDHILGTGPGFTDRISARLRDREGLAYTVYARIANSAGTEPGLFTCYIGTDNVNFARAKELFLEELNRIRDTKATAEELADAKAYLIGSQILHYSTLAGVAGQLVAIEHYKLGLNYIEDYQKAVKAVTLEDIQAVAKKYIDPARMVLIAAGAVDEKGAPLKEK